MDTVTIQGPIVVLPADTYQELLDRIGQLEANVARLAEASQDLEDIRFMREAEAEYKTGDAASFAQVLDEVLAEAE